MQRSGIQRMNRILCGLALSACALMAQADPPGRVARLSYVYGNVSFRPAGVDDWSPVDYNRPLTTGDQMFVEFAGSAELQLGSAALRMKTSSALEFLNLDDSNVQLRLTQGSLIIRLRDLGDQDSFEVDTPNSAFTLLRTGEYRIDVKPDSSSTLVTVRGGQGELTGPNQAFTVRAGEQAQVLGDDQPNFQSLAAPPPDEFDAWSEGRDQRDDQSPSARYVSRQMVGYQDLDRYGSWRNTPDYGNVWVPSGTPDGWAPYHNGHWLWVDPWGWTWVDDAPWGFAPFHYGRWAYIGNSWGWIPGPVAERPVYAPALVAWVGGGAVGGGVAWFALGPREVYVPSYHTSPVYLNRVNVSNTVIVNNNVNVNVTNVQYVNRGAPGAVMAVQQSAFASARPVQSAAIAVRPDAIRSAPVMATAAIAPTRASLTRTPAPGAKIVQPPAALQSRPVVARRTPPPPPVPFAQKQQALAGNAGRPLDTNQVQQIRQSQPAPARAVVRQVQARTPSATPPPPAPAAQGNRPGGQAPPQRTPGAPSTPAPAAQAPTPQTARPLGERPGQPLAPAQQTARPQNDRPTQPPAAAPQTERPLGPPPLAPAQPTARPQNDRPTQPPAAAPQTARPSNERPLQTPNTPAAPPPAAQRPAPAPVPPVRATTPPNEARPEQPRQAPPAPAQPPAPSREVQRPAPAETRAAPPSNPPAPRANRPPPKKEGDKKDRKDEK